MPIVERTFYAHVDRDVMVEDADELGIDWRYFRHALCDVKITGTIDTDSEVPGVRITRVEYGRQVLVPERKQFLCARHREQGEHSESGMCVACNAIALVKAHERSKKETP